MPHYFFIRASAPQMECCGYRLSGGSRECRLITGPPSQDLPKRKDQREQVVHGLLPRLQVQIVEPPETLAPTRNSPTEWRSPAPWSQRRCLLRCADRGSALLVWALPPISLIVKWRVWAASEVASTGGSSYPGSVMRARRSSTSSTASISPATLRSLA